MKNLALTLATTVLFLLMSSCAVRAQLSDNAILVRDHRPDTYRPIMLYAADKWGNDYQMIEHTINKQIEAYLSIGDIVNSTAYDQELMVSSYTKWFDTKTKGGDYVMILHDYMKQLEAKASIMLQDN